MTTTIDLSAVAGRVSVKRGRPTLSTISSRVVAPDDHARHTRPELAHAPYFLAELVVNLVLGLLLEELDLLVHDKDLLGEQGPPADSHPVCHA